MQRQLLRACAPIIDVDLSLSQQFIRIDFTNKTVGDDGAEDWQNVQ
jgi:hypothetical protein